MLSRAAYILQVAPIAEQVTSGSGVFPQTLIAQSIVESQRSVNGIYYPGQSLLAKEYNNYFGIKAGNNWPGETVTLDTREETPQGVSYTIKGKFRAYNSLNSSFKDYVKFLQDNPRYDEALKAPDYTTQIKRIAAAGYATDNNYANIVIGVANRVNKALKLITNFVDVNKYKLLTGSIIIAIAFFINKNGKREKI